MGDHEEVHIGVLVCAGGSELVLGRGFRFVFRLHYLLLSTFQLKTNAGSIPR